MKLYFITGLATILIGIYASIETIKELDAKYYGETIQAKCTATPNLCIRRKNKIDVVYQNKAYSIHIGDTQCLDQYFRANEHYQFKYSNKFDFMTTQQRIPEIMIPILLFIFGVAGYCFWKMKKSK